RILALDQDPQALQLAGRRLKRFGPRVKLVPANFRDLASVAEVPGAVFFDLGVSSMQLDRPERGFSYREDGPLDMRMDQDVSTSAREVVNSYPENQLSALLSRYGQERFSRRIARAIVQRRAERPFERTLDLAEVIKQAIPAATRRTGPHPARRSFQAIRIEVNRELEVLEQALTTAVEMLAPGGRVAVISYHSLEDRIVKAVFRQFERGCECPRDLPVCRCGKQAVVRVLTRKAVRPSAEERQANPRSDSAAMRAAEKLERAA
ncbi:MAG: 16S rRNA (cytosine(1402)-N(4))-methyltransferase RsmH, partial [Actinomycetota bacterium]